MPDRHTLSPVNAVTSQPYASLSLWHTEKVFLFQHFRGMTRAVMRATLRMYYVHSYQAHRPTAAVRAQGGEDFFLCALSRVHARCGALPDEALEGSSKVSVEIMTHIARDMFKTRAGELANKALMLTDTLTNLADRTTLLV